jgi:hypothetical protein
VPATWAGTSKVVYAGVPASCEILCGDKWEYVDGKVWSYEVRDGAAIVTAGPREGVVTMPAVLGGCPVTGWENFVFSGCTRLSLTIPDSVTSIGDEAFRYYCSGLTSVTIPDSVTSIGWSAFSGCSGLTAVHIHDLAAWCGISFGDNPLSSAHHLFLDGVEVTDLTISNGVTSIAGYAFSGCSGLTSVTIPDSVTSIGDYAFYDCSGLTNVTIPGSVTSIRSYAFSDCSGLTSVTLLDGVTSIGDDAFYGCNCLTSLTIPDSVTSIGSYAFYGCTALTSLTIPDSVTSIVDGAFYGCSGLTNVTIPDSVTSIGWSAFYGCSSLTSMTIPDSVTSIWGGAFEGCSGLKTLSVPGAWEGTTMLEYTSVPEGCVVVYRKGGDDLLPEAGTEAEVVATLDGAADGRLKERIRSVEEYEAFRAWVSGKSLDAGAVMKSATAWISYALGAEGLFENEPEIVLGEVSVGRSGAKAAGSGVAVEVSVKVNDGGTAVAVDASKVMNMFEATGNLGDWDETSAIPVTVTPTGSEGPVMQFEVVPDDPTTDKAFLRLAP